MKTTRTLAINTRWGNANKATSTLHRHPKRHKPTETYLFYLLPKYILMEIDFLASRLEHSDKIKAIITKIHPSFNPP